eukprot:gnl/TRDRNA2_/TRDRNA2_205979_c0_seq1.p1 gnl/TRDRNA2_/TRDRNA2_205979_c0~~gnl/TRDRNA2_/TRDRNA2_205979_c0_seq1.p1  ORF type:complete len:285 (-),score=35.92 gnl/TRDRNA2_/TRDRNA2_205979_c0_seq1:53-907(-)
MSKVHGDVRYLKSEWRGAAEPPTLGKGNRRGLTALHTVDVYDARPMTTSPDVDVERTGFALLQFHTALDNFANPRLVRSVLYTEIATRMKEITGCRDVFFRKHVVRLESNKGFNEAYSRFVHLDGSSQTGRDTMSWKMYLASNPRAATAVEAKSFDYAWYNFWMPIDHTVEQNHLCIIDSRTVDADDLVAYVYDRGPTQKDFAVAPVYSEGHKWFYFPRLTPGEAIIFKQQDTRHDLLGGGIPRSRWTPHTSFYDTNAPSDAPPRRSIDVRVCCVFDRSAEARL